MDDQLLVRTKNINKYFGYVKALQNVSLDLHSQEILGLVGDNAAGKSTLLKILAGVYIPDEGQIFLEGNRVEINKPMAARNLGIETIYQDFMLCPKLNIIKNIFLARELTKWSFMGKLRKRDMEKEARRVLKECGFNMSVRLRVSNLSGGQQQTVAIARALLHPPKVILMDEPTASLSEGAIDRFLNVVKELKLKGCSIIYVSHRLPTVLEVADRIIVLRGGKKVAVKQKSETSVEEIVGLMMGKIHA